MYFSVAVSKKRTAHTTAQQPYYRGWQLAAILAFTVILYAGSLRNGFVLNWDDTDYIIKNPYIRQLNLDNIRGMFSQFYASNYHPFTTFVNAIEYSLWGTSPAGYHVVNLLLHLVNIVLCARFVWLLSGKREVALAVALLFAVHPMHVETVAWVSDQKDLLCTLFVLLSLSAYLNYLRNSAIRHLGYCLLMYVLSLLAKPVSVTLPLMLMVLHYFYTSTINIREYLKLFPFFAFSLSFGIVAIMAQNSGGSLSDFSHIFSAGERALLVLYGMGFYIIKAMVPIGLSALHFYPSVANGLPLKYYSGLLVVAIVVALIIKSDPEQRKVLLTGLLLYLLWLLPVLQIMSVGRALVAERYSYFSYVGLFYAIAAYVAIGIEKRNMQGNLPRYLFLGLALVYSALTFARIPVWKNGISLFEDVVQKYPDSGEGYGILAYSLKNEGNKQKALHFYNTSIEMDPANFRTITSRGLLRADLKDHAGAIEDFSRAIAIQKEYRIYFNRANSRMALGQMKEAVADFDSSLAMNPAFTEPYNLRGSAKMLLKDHEGALKDFAKALQYSPANTETMLSMGACKAQLGRKEEALKDFDKVLGINPAHAGAYFNRGYCKLEMGKKQEACADIEKAMQMGLKQAEKVYFANCLEMQ